MVSNSISIDREKDSELLQVQEFLETLKNNPDQVINSVIKKDYLELLNIAFEKAKTDRNWKSSVLPALLSLGIVENREVKEKYLELLNIDFENAKTDGNWAQYVLPALLSLGIVENREVKEKYLELLNIAFENAKTDRYWAQYVLPELLSFGIVENREVKEKYLELLNIAFENAKTDRYWASSALPALLSLGILGKEDKEKYLELLNIVFENAKTDRDWASSVLPALLKLGIVEKEELQKALLTKEKPYRLFEILFLQKHSQKLSAQDLIQFWNLDAILTWEEKQFLCKQTYDDFLTLQKEVEKKNYQALWQFKCNLYPKEEQSKLARLKDYFWDEVWIYFFDKVHTEKDLKNRFRDPHNALLHSDKIIQLAQELEKKGISKSDFIKNYLGIAGDRNSGYQQLNDFLIKYTSNWQDLIIKELNDPQGLWDPAFVECVQRILDQDKTGELYQNLDSLEQITTVLKIIKSKESLIKLQKLAVSNDPQDQVLYNYFRDAIYHPRTKPLIMQMYEQPKKFLGLDDMTFSGLQDLHQAKKPSNMVESFPELDFSAEDLVNCLPLWVYDELSYFKPYEKQYLVNWSSVYTVQEVKNQILDFLSSSDQKRKSTIITKYNALFPDTPLSFKAWKENPQNFVENLLKQSDFSLWIDIFTQLRYQEFNKYKNLRLMTAKISPKSDPNNRFNGFNCDSLAEGHGKKVVAMFNPYCSDFCIYQGEPDPKVDNLKVTSRVTLNRAIPHNFNSLLDKAKKTTTYAIAALFGEEFEDYKDPKEYVITMDNIEADANFGNKHAIAIRKIYEDFFSEYIEQHPVSPNGIPLNTSKFYSGISHNKINILTKREENQTLPVFMNSYTDNAQSQSLVGELHAGTQAEKVKKTWIHPLSIEDVDQISYLEGKIYPETMKHHLGNLQHEITASFLNNQLKGRANLSFAWYDDKGKVRGYLLAYQGKMEDGRAWIYLSDFAIDKQARGHSGLEMIRHWIQQVKEHYPGMPVFTRARETTSYRMLKALVEKYGYEITESKKVRDAGENFYWITMEEKKS